jgi:hypothetical protein
MEAEDAPRLTLPERHFPPSPEELAAHKIMLEKIKNPVWSA